MATHAAIEGGEQGESVGLCTGTGLTEIHSGLSAEDMLAECVGANGGHGGGGIH